MELRGRHRKDAGVATLAKTFGSSTRQVWRVEARRGDSELKVRTHGYATNADACTAIAAMMGRPGGPTE
jgi:hypothetical protein